MPTLVLSERIMRDLAKVPKDVAGKVTDLAVNFGQQAFAGAHLETPKAARDGRVRTVRVDNFWRGVVHAPEQGDTFMLLRIMPHDDAYAWAQRNVVRINPATGGVEVVNVVELEEAAAAAIPDAASVGLFAEISDSTLIELGISFDVLPLVRTLHSDEQLLVLAGLLPANQSDVLLSLADGASPEEVWAQVVGAGPAEAVDPTDFDAALKRDVTAAEFVTVEGPEELLDILSKPLDLWRVFLHPTQRRIAYRPAYSGPVRVTGGAGTGKTVVAMHRAKALADQLPADQPILFTTFTKNLAGVIGRNLEVLGGKALRTRVTVSNVDRIAVQVVRDAEGVRPLVLSAAEERHAWDHAIETTSSGLDREFLADEWEQVILAQAISSRDDYLRAARPGRGGRLDRRQRLAVWDVIEAFGAHQRQTGKRTFLQLALEAAGYLRTRVVKPYAAVIVDEAQDLHPAQWRMLRAAVAEGPNDMFIVGDAFQRIYSNRTTLSKVGIHVVGRSYRLRINYRTTRQILHWAVALLKGVDADDLDGGADTLVGYHSLLSGGPPIFEGFASAGAEETRLVAWVRSLLENGFENNEIAIACRTNATRDHITGALTAAGIPAQVIEGDMDPSSGAVSVGTMHRMKGLEFRAVAVADCSHGSVPLPAAIVPENIDSRAHARSLETERSLLFVACTRSREVLLVTWSGRPSEFLATTGVAG